MKAYRIIATAAALLVASSLALPVAQAHEVDLGDIKRMNLFRNDLSAPEREVIPVLVEFGPGVTAVIQAKNSSISPKARWSISATAGRR